MKPKCCFLLVLVLSLFIYKPAAAQLKSDDFKLLLDGKEYTSLDSITIGEFLKLKQVTANFQWIVINSMMIYTIPAKPAFCTLIYPVFCEGNAIGKNVIEELKLYKEDVSVLIQASAVNRSGQPVKVPDLCIRLRAIQD